MEYLCYFTKDKKWDSNARIVKFSGGMSWESPDISSCCVRPAVLFSQIQNMCSNWMINDNGDFTVECGSLPQQSLSPQLEDELDRNLDLGLLKEVDFIPIKGVDQQMYEYQGKKYVIVRANPGSDTKDNVYLSNEK